MDYATRAITWVAHTESRGNYGAQNKNLDGAGLSYGLIQWTQKSGSLGKLLEVLRARDPAAFDTVFGPDAAKLVAVTTSPYPAVRMSLALWAAPWTSRFEAAGRHPPFQAAQLQAAARPPVPRRRGRPPAAARRRHPRAPLLPRGRRPGRPPRGPLGARARRPHPRPRLVGRVASRGFDRPRLFSAYLHTLRWNCVTATDPKLFQAPYRAGIEVKAYQLEPLRKALALPRVNLFIADDVGLGKTIEAGLILRELLLRQKVRRVVVACRPRSCASGGRAGAALRPHLRHLRPRLRRPPPPRARLRRQPLDHPHPLHHLARPPARRGLRRPAARLARRRRRGLAAHPRRGPQRRPRLERRATPSTPSSPAPCATSRRASSTASSSRPRPTTATPTASPPCSRSSTPSASAAASRSTPSSSTRSWCAASSPTCARSPRRLPRAPRRPRDRHRRPPRGRPRARPLAPPRALPRAPRGPPRRRPKPSGRRACSW
jgi:hypothetical protein